MSISDVVKLLSGVALFLFGMSVMGDSLKKVAGNKLELFLYKLSDTPLKGLLLGTGVTAVIQSSSATSVMVVGFVNSGMMQVKQAFGVILGSILGTSITGWVISLSYISGGSGWVQLLSTATLTGIIAVIGIYLRMFCKGYTKKHLGDIFLGFAVLMTGMQTMSGAVAGLKSDPAFLSALTAFSNPLTGILVGTLITAVLQSASAAVGILQALSVTGAITFDAALPLLMGMAIGASVPVMLSALGAGVNGRRTAMVYPISEIVGVAVFSALFYIANAVIGFAFMKDVSDPFNIAAINTVFRLFKVVLLMPLVSPLEKLVTVMVKEKPEEAVPQPQFKPEERFLKHPALAVEQVGIFMQEMARIAKDNLHAAIALLFDYSEEGFKAIERSEDIIDRYEDGLGSYLVQLTRGELSDEQNRLVSMYLHTISDIERISDHSLNLAENAKTIHEKGIHFSETGLIELKTITKAVADVISRSVKALDDNDPVYARTIEPLEQLIDDFSDEVKLHHIERIREGICTYENGFVFNDMLTNFERISDHCSNIAVAVISLQKDSFDTHRYLDNVKNTYNEQFDKLYNEYRRKYRIN